MVQAKFTRVSKAHLCPVCEGDHKCSFTADGLFLCGRKTGEQPGFVCLGPSKNPTWTMYRNAESTRVERARVESGKTVKSDTLHSPLAHSGTSFTEQAAFFARDITSHRKAILADQLKLPVAALNALPDLGWDEANYSYTIPEYDAQGRVIGISLRRTDGTKRCVAGSRRGLVFTAGWIDDTGPILIVEGMSDVVALAAVGLHAIGRPSSHVGGDMIAALLQTVDKTRPIFVLGENDQKPDGRWPGKEGATAVARQLTAALPGRTILCAAPAGNIKDVRDWVVSRLSVESDSVAGDEKNVEGAKLTGDRPWALKIGRDIVTTLSQSAKRFLGQPADHARRWPAPVPITTIAAEVDADPSPTGWLWDGYLPRNGIVLLSALPKCGKTTLLTHLLAAISRGGEFLGRTLLPGRAVVITEEDRAVWAARQHRHNLTEDVALEIRPFTTRPTLDDWISFLSSLTADLEAGSRDLIILDTLADLWPVRDENHATDVTDCLKPLRQLAQHGRTVLCIHHVRKSGGEHGTASRGSGAIAGFFDVLIELGYATGDPDGRRRKLTARGRLDGIPGEALIEMTKDGTGYQLVDASATAKETVKRRDDTETDRRSVLYAVLSEIIPEGDETVALTREEIWNRLPEDVRVNVKRFESVLEDGVGEMWTKIGGSGGVPSRYWRSVLS